MLTMAFSNSSASIQQAAKTGPLQVHAGNRRYFSDGAGKAVYLTGSHLGWELHDDAWDEKVVFDYEAYLNFLEEHNHNLIRMWVVEHTRSTAGRPDALAHPMPFRRTGPGAALDGAPKFDLTEFDPVFFDRLRSRVIAARDRGIYVIVMLFQGWSINVDDAGKNPWFGHYFNADNNSNGIDGDADRDGLGREIHINPGAEVRRIQQAFVRKVIDTVNDLDNVLYEISNESPAGSRNWQYELIRFLKAYEAGKPRQHAVIMSKDLGQSVAHLLASPADAICPGRGTDYLTDPPAADGTKVVIADSDHIEPRTKDRRFVWKNFLRGNNPIVLDWDLAPVLKTGGSSWRSIRQAMGQTRVWAGRLDLAAVVPQGRLASTGYCLASPGTEYLVYQPENGPFAVDLLPGSYAARWFDPGTGTSTKAVTVRGGRRVKFAPPFASDAVLHLRAVRQKFVRR